MSDWVHAFEKFSNVSLCGSDTYPSLLVSAIGRSAT
jgi:hypothetical protein